MFGHQPTVFVVPDGYYGRMTSYSSDESEAIQAVIDRVSSYQDGAPEGTVKRELGDGLAEAGLDVNAEDVAGSPRRSRMEHGKMNAGSVLG